MWIVRIASVGLALGVAACNNDVVCETPSEVLATCMVVPKGQCKGPAHELTEGDKKSDGQTNRGADTCYKLGYKSKYLGGYTK